MKKILAMIIAILVCAALAACTNDASAGEETGGDDSNYAAEDMETGRNIGNFSSEDLDGDKVTEAIFADKDVTVLNIWATFCGPCISEMPDLAALAGELPENAQVIGIVIDTPKYENIDLARKICSEAGVKYTNVVASKSVLETFAFVDAVPTTFILDKSGNVIGKPIVGANVEGYKKAAEEYLAGL
ncbi:MAG: TlpA family protein disulfide reductase [Mogibacterium sp.]|nr:TlpA family protein disulfide reductase [Mogibacterium sp.]